MDRPQTHFAQGFDTPFAARTRLNCLVASYVTKSDLLVLVGGECGSLGRQPGGAFGASKSLSNRKLRIDMSISYPSMAT